VSDYTKRWFGLDVSPEALQQQLQSADSQLARFATDIAGNLFGFATSILRGAAGNVVFSSVIVIDMRERPLHARLLVDRVGAIPRLTPAVTRTALDASALAANPEYLPELRRIMAGAIAKQKLEEGP